MHTFTKSIALFFALFSFTSCDEDPQEKNEQRPTKSEQPMPEATSIEKEIDRMLEGKEGNQSVLKKDLVGKPKTHNVELVKEGINRFEKTHGTRPDPENISLAIGALDVITAKLKLEATEQRNARLLEDIEKRLSKQLDKERQ